MLAVIVPVSADAVGQSPGILAAWPGHFLAVDPRGRALG